MPPFSNRYYIYGMKTTSRTGAGLTSTVSGLTDDALLAQTRQLARIEQQLNVTVIDHLREIEARRLYLRRGFSSLFDYAVRELGYTDSAASRRINAMRLCKEFEEVREGLQDGSITLTTAAQLQNAFDRQKRNRRRRERGPVVGSGPAAPRQDSLLAPPDGDRRTARTGAGAGRFRAEGPGQAGGRQEHAAGAGVAGRRGPRTGGLGRQGAAAGQRALRDEGRGRRRVPPRAGAAPGAAVPRGPAHDAGAACRAAGARGARSPRPGPAPAPSAHRQPVRERGRNFGGEGASQRQHHFGAEDEAATPDGQARSAAHRNAQPTRAATSAPKRSAPSGRAIPAAVRRQVWQRDAGRRSYVDPRSGRRCASRHLLQTDHRFPFALGGGTEPDNLRLLCAAHHRHRHEGRASPREPAE